MNVSVVLVILKVIVLVVVDCQIGVGVVYSLLMMVLWVFLVWFWGIEKGDWFSLYLVWFSWCKMQGFDVVVVWEFVVYILMVFLFLDDVSVVFVLVVRVGDWEVFLIIFVNVVFVVFIVDQFVKFDGFMQQILVLCGIGGGVVECFSFVFLVVLNVLVFLFV